LVYAILFWFVMGCTGVKGQFLESQDDIGEVGAYGGAGFGGLGARAWVGAATGVQFSKYAVALIDTSFMPLGGATLVRYPAATDTSRLYDFNFTIHIQVPTKHRLVPYGLGGAALLFNTYQVRTVHPDGVVVAFGRSDAKFGFETGGGARYFIRRDWGVKGEYRYTVSTHSFSRILAGVFYQFDGTWPFLPNRNGRRGRRVSE
jgi:opacity protein-like surface antigen